VADLFNPIRTDHWKLLGTILWGSAIAIVFVLLQIVTMLAVMLRAKGELTEQQSMDLLVSAQSDGVLLSVSTFATTIACGALIVGIIRLKRGAILADYLAIRAVPPMTLLKWLGFLALFLAVSDLTSIILGRPLVPEFVTTTYNSTSPVWLIWVALVVAAPIFEEGFFRGFLFRGFASSFMGPIGATILTAGLWAVIHAQYDSYGIGTIFFLGLLFGAARMSTGSLLVPLAMHAVSNFLSAAEAALMSWRHVT